ncbi:MAG: ATP-binding protein [Oscillospiraceae bacterium]|nr:ATP-binding protein [Oscillospiraceae bacterium]
MLRKLSTNFKPNKRSAYWTVLCVLLSFAAMVVSSYLFSADIELKHLEDESDLVFAGAQVQLFADLQEFESLFSIISETIRYRIVEGAEFDDIKHYITDMTNYSRDLGDMADLVAVFGMFDVFGGEGFNGKEPDFDWAALEGWDPTARPWYSAAVEANGEVASTEPYSDVVTGAYAFTFARAIFDADGNRLAIICVDIEIERMYDFVYNRYANSEHELILFDSDLVIMAHSGGHHKGEYLGDITCELVGVLDELVQTGTVNHYRYTNHDGTSRAVSVRKLDNGWYLGVSILADKYHSNLDEMRLFLIALGAGLSLVLSGILLSLVSERNKAEEHSQILLDAMPLGANFWDKSGNNIATNEATVKLFKLKNQAEYLARFDDLSPETQPDGELSEYKRHKVVNQAFEEGYCRFEWMHQDLVGELIPCEITLVRVPYKGDFIVTGYTRDLREQKEMERSKEASEAASNAKSVFLATVSHEIRTPMNTILGITEIQLQKDTHTPEVEEVLNQICDAGNLLLNIINDILDFSKIEAGMLDIVNVKYDVPSLVNDSIKLNYVRYESKPIKFIVNLDSETPLQFFGDEFRIKQVLNNLLSNAFKYTERGEVELYVTAVSTASVEENATEDDFILVLRVTDTGVGMNAKQLEQLFVEFMRFSDNRIAGTGLGMSITQRLVNAMNGEITVDSTPGEGSVFTVRLPQKRIGTDVCGKHITAKFLDFDFRNAQHTKKLRIVHEYMPYGSVLVVDDVSSNLLVAKGMLLPYGLKIQTVSSGKEALRLIEGGKVYDVIFMDHMMPEMDGIETVKLIRERGYKGWIGALTANAMVGQADVFLKNGFDFFLSKPIDSRELNNVLNEFILKRQPREVVEAARRQLTKDNGQRAIDEQ